MKKIALMLSIAAVAVACNKLAEHQFEITGNVDPTWEGRKVVLCKPAAGMPQPVDTVVVKDGKFVFTDTISKPELYLVSVDGVPMQYADFILEPGEIEIKVDKDTLGKSVAKGTYNNEKYTDFKELNRTYYLKNMKLQKATFNESNQATAMQDTALINKFTKEREGIYKEFDGKLKTFIKDNPKAYASMQALGTISSLGITQLDELEKIFNTLDPAIKNTKEGKQIAEFFKKQKETAAGPQPQPDGATDEATIGVKVGEMAPQFSAATPDGKTLSLKQAMGKVTLIDFWASWCPPCRAANPHLVEVYKKYHAKGFNIIGVSLDKAAEPWKKAIEKDKLEWAQVSNLKFWEDPIAKEYGVKAIPAPVLIDASGKIVSVGVGGAELEAKIKELL